jgi:hypothetical protein
MNRSDRVPFRVQPMLATLVPEPFNAKGWVFEEKYDGDLDSSRVGLSVGLDAPGGTLA